MLIATCFIALFLALIGWGIHKQKWYFLISGYNTMSKEEQQKVDVESMAKSTATMLYVIALLIVVLGFASYFELTILVVVAVIGMVVVPFVMMFTSGKIMKQAMSSKTKKISIWITVLSFVFVAVLIYFSLQDTAITVDNESLVIEGMYGDTVAIEDIRNVQLLEDFPKIEMRTNGSAIGSKLKGHFKLADGEKAKLFIDKSKPPFIKLETNDQIYYFNTSNAQDTTALYEELK